MVIKLQNLSWKRRPKAHTMKAKTTTKATTTTTLSKFPNCCTMGSHCPDWDYIFYVFLQWDHFLPKLNI